MKKIYIVALILLTTAKFWGQISFPRPDFNPFRVPENTLFNPNLMTMSHSMGFEASSSSTGNAFYLSRYTNHIHYQFNPKLEMQLDLNFVNYGSANTSNSIDFNDDNKSSVLPAFSMTYRPSDNVRIDLRFEQAYSPDYYNRHWNGRWDEGSRNWYSRW